MYKSKWKNASDSNSWRAAACERREKEIEVLCSLVGIFIHAPTWWCVLVTNQSIYRHRSKSCIFWDSGIGQDCDPRLGTLLQHLRNYYFSYVEKYGTSCESSDEALITIGEAYASSTRTPTLTSVESYHIAGFLN